MTVKRKKYLIEQNYLRTVILLFISLNTLLRASEVTRIVDIIHRFQFLPSSWFPSSLEAYDLQPNIVAKANLSLYTIT